MQIRSAVTRCVTALLICDMCGAYDFPESSKCAANFLRYGRNSNARSSCFEKKPIIVPLSSAMTSVPQPRPSSLPKKHSDITVLANSSVTSTAVLKTGRLMPYRVETAFTKKS